MTTLKYKTQIIKHFLIVMTILMSNLLYAQVKIKGNRDVRSEQTTVSDFKTLAVGNEFEVNLIKSINPSVTVEADANLHSSIIIDVNDSILNITFTKSFKRAKAFKLTVRYTDKFDSMILRDDVNVETNEVIRLPDFSLTMKDNAKIKASFNTENFELLNENDSNFKFLTNCQLNIESKQATLNLKKKSNNIIQVNAEALKINMYDSADLDIEGFSYNLDVNAINSSDLEGKNLLTNTIKTNIKDSAKVALQASDSIHVDASGKSELSIYGEPKIIIDQLANKASILKKEF